MASAVSMMACRLFGVTDSVVSKLRTRETVALDTPTASAISFSVTIVLLPLDNGQKGLPASDAMWRRPSRIYENRRPQQLKYLLSTPERYNRNITNRLPA